MLKRQPVKEYGALKRSGTDVLISFLSLEADKWGQSGAVRSTLRVQPGIMDETKAEYTHASEQLRGLPKAEMEAIDNRIQTSLAAILGWYVSTRIGPCGVLNLN